MSVPHSHFAEVFELCSSSRKSVSREGLRFQASYMKWGNVFAGRCSRVLERVACR